MAAVPFRGWRVVGGAFSVLTLAFGGVYAFPAFVTPLEQTFPGSRGDIALVFGLAGFLSFAVGAPAGQIADRIGSRPIVAAGVTLIGAGLVLASIGDTLWQVLIPYGLGVGFGVGLAYVPSVGPVQRWFTKRRGLATSLAVTGIGIGTFLGPLAAALLIRLGDWRSAWLAMGATVVLGGLLATRLIIDSPAQVGQRPDGAGDETSNAEPGEPWGLRVAAAIRTRPFLLTYAGAFLMSFPLYLPFVHLVPYAADRGMATEAAVAIASLIGIGSILGRFASGALADRIGLRHSFIGTFAGLTLAFALWIFADSAWWLGVFALLHGLCYGAFVALTPPLTIAYLGARRASGLLGTLYTAVGPGTLLGAPLAGYAFDLWRSYDVPLIAAAVTMLLSTLLVAFLPDPARWRQRYRGVRSC
jgi:MFS family permease